MKVNISHNIISLLKKAGRVSLPQIGTFTLRRYAASLSVNRSTISPPSYSIIYADIVKDIEALVSEISLNEKISKNKAKQILLSYTDQLSKDLKKTNTAYIHQLGNLSKKGGKLVFDQEQNSLLSSIHYALPVVNLKPIERDVEEKITLIEKIQESRTEVKIPTRSEPIISYRKESNKSSWFNWKDWLIAALVTCLIICLYHTCSHKTQLPNSGNAFIDTLAVAGKINNNTTDTAKKINKIIASKENVQTTCIIITGSFKRSRNAVSMQDRIIALGYEPFMENNDGFNRVGIKFDCKGLDLENFMYKIRSQFDIYAWYLEPDLEVER